MFTFKPYDDCDLYGRSKDRIFGDLKRVFHFSIHCEGLDELDNKIFVWIDEKGILFLRESDEISEAEKGKVIAAISLTNPKDTGHDLLFFGEHIKKQSLISTNIKDDKLSAFLSRAEKIFKGFPFFKDEKNIIRGKKKYNRDRVFIRLCLLEFLLAVDTHDEIFSVYPGFDELRKKLRESKVYLLLCAKLRYCMYHYNDRKALNKEEYTFVVTKYADILMESDFNKIVPPDYFDKRRFLYNPEYEMRQIVQRSDYGIIDSTVKEKIKAFFLTKHAVLEPFTSSLSNLFDESKRARWIFLRNAYICFYYFFMIFFVVWALYSFFLFDNEEPIINNFYEACPWKWGLIIILFIVGAISLWNNKSAVFHPRIIVALMMGWFTIAISEDLIKSQLYLNAWMVLVALIIVLLIVGMMLWGEIRQHSPYYMRWPWKFRNLPKMIVVMFYSLFWNIILGIIMQGITYSPLLMTSGTIPSAVSGQFPNDVEIYKQHVSTCIKILDEYDRSMEGIIHDHGEGYIYSKVEANPLDTSLTVKSTYSTIIKREYNVFNVHERYLKNIGDWLKRAEKNMKVKFYFGKEDKGCFIMPNRESAYRAHADSAYYVHEETMEEMKVDKRGFNNNTLIEGKNPSWEDLYKFLDSCKLNSTKIATKDIERNLDQAREIKNKLRVELFNIDQFVTEVYNSDSLFAWVKVGKNPNTISFKTNNYYLAYLGYNAVKNQKYYRELVIPFFKIEDKILRIPIYPRMLIFHSLIVLLIAFVGQLIISDKSVTEPL